VVASDEEHDVITTNPEEIVNRREAERLKKAELENPGGKAVQYSSVQQRKIDSQEDAGILAQSRVPSKEIMDSLKQNSQIMEQQKQAAIAKAQANAPKQTPQNQSADAKPQLHGYYSIDQYSSPQDTNK
jgi:hypothetical protein